MTLAEVASLVRLLTPSLHVVEDCLLLVLGDEAVPAERQVRSLLSDYRGELRTVERDLNRKFLIAGVLDQFDLGTEAQRSPELLVELAEHLAALVRDCAARTLPGQPVDVEIIGQTLAADEPLEVCVTLMRAA